MRTKLYSILLIALSILSIIAPLFTITSMADSLIDRAINEGIQYIVRSIAPLDSSYSKAVIRDHPGIPISVEWNGKRIIAGSSLDPGNRDYYEESNVGNNTVFERYYFNLNGDDTYDVIVEVKVVNVDSVNDMVIINVTKCSLQGVKLYVGSDYPIVYNIYEGWTTSFTIPYYYQTHYSARYVARHSTRIAAWLLEEVGYDEFAQALHNFMDSMGFTYDVYAPVFGKSNSYPDNFFDYYQTWLGNGYDAHPWYFSNSLILYPYKSRMYIASALGPQVMDVFIRGWKSAPLYKLLYALHLMNKYRNTYDAQKYIIQALKEGGWDGYGLSTMKVDVAYVLTGVPLGITITQPYNGHPVYLNAVLLITLIRYYQLTGSQYISDGSTTYNILDMIDRLAGILLSAQWIRTQYTIYGLLTLSLYRGGFPACYDIKDMTLVVGPSAWGIFDTATAGLDAIAGMVWNVINKYGPWLGFVLDALKLSSLAKALIPMPSEFVAIVNSESTILAVKALMMYKQLGRTPQILYGYTNLLEGGTLVSTGGWGTGLIHRGITSIDGKYMGVYAYSSLGFYTIRWQDATFKINLTRPANLLIIRGLVSYFMGVYGPGYARLMIVVGVDSPNSQYYRPSYIVNNRYVIDELDTVGERNGTKVVDIVIDLGTLNPGEYYITITLHAYANQSGIIDALGSTGERGLWLKEIVLATKDTNSTGDYI